MFAYPIHLLHSTMGKLNYLSLTSVLVILVANQLTSGAAVERRNANSQGFDHITLTKLVKQGMNNGNKCYKLVAMVGNGIQDYFKEKCESSNWFTTGPANILGDPSVHAFCLYQDTWAQLIVIRQGVCTMYEYETEMSGKTTKKQVDISVRQCDTVKQEMTRAHQENIMEPGQGYKEGKRSVNDKRLVVDAEERAQADGSCVLEVRALGRGVQDSFRETCLKGKAQEITRDDLLIYGDIDMFTFCLFSDNWNTLLVIKKDQCFWNVYTTTEKGTIGRVVSITERACADVKEKIVSLIKQEKNYWRNWSEQLASVPSQQQQVPQKNSNSVWGCCTAGSPADA